MPMKSIEEILSDDVKLPSLPSIALRIIEAVKTEEASLSEMAKIVSSDPASILSARTRLILNTGIPTENSPLARPSNSSF